MTCLRLPRQAATRADLQRQHQEQQQLQDSKRRIQNIIGQLIHFSPTLSTFRPTRLDSSTSGPEANCGNNSFSAKGPRATLKACDDCPKKNHDQLLPLEQIEGLTETCDKRRDNKEETNQLDSNRRSFSIYLAGLSGLSVFADDCVREDPELKKMTAASEVGDE